MKTRPLTQAEIAMQDEWISVGAAARTLGRSTRQVHHYIECGALQSRRIGPRGWVRVKRDDVARLVGQLETAERGKPIYGS